MEASIIDCGLEEPLANNNHIYTVRFFNKSIVTSVTPNPLTVHQWILDTESFRYPHTLVVGLDIQCRPTFACRRIPATITLSAGDRCIVFQFLYSTSIPESLVLFFNNPKNKFVGVGIKNGLDLIEKEFKYGFAPPSIVDLGEVAAREFGDRQMEELAKRELNLVVVRPREIAFSRWDNRILTYHQVLYACIEAFLSQKIGMAI